MTTLWWANANPTAAITNTAVEGDIFVATLAVEQRRKNAGGGWDVIVPPDTRGDVAPWAFSHQIAGANKRDFDPGQVNDRLAVIGTGRPWELGWLNAATGVVGPPAEASPTGVEGRHVQTTPLQDWNVEHNLSCDLVDVTVISDDGDILVPEVSYTTAMTCVLHFLDPVSGTAIVRR